MKEKSLSAPAERVCGGAYSSFDRLRMRSNIVL
jgi:hypothetical protein